MWGKKMILTKRRKNIIFNLKKVCINISKYSKYINNKYQTGMMRNVFKSLL